MLDAYADRWALVTGASSGIGAEFARVLAARGMHLVMAARRRELMEEIADSLHTRHGTQTEIVSTNLSDPIQAKALFDHLRTKQIEIELLVNNAGFGVAGEFDASAVDRVLEMTRINVGALTELTYRFLPGMIERGHGAIINVASAAGFQPVAYMGAYAATKAYVLHLSEALWAEVRDSGVTVMALCPGTTRTNFFDVAGVPGWLKKRRPQEPSEVVKAAMKALEKKRQYIVPGWRDYLVSLVVRLGTRRTVVSESMKYFRPKRRAK